MPERDVRVVNSLGLHARPAAQFVRMASGFRSDVTLRRGDLAVNGKSIMGVMMLAAECGSTLTISTTGDDAEQALEALAGLVAGGFGEQ